MTVTGIFLKARDSVVMLKLCGHSTQRYLVHQLAHMVSLHPESGSYLRPAAQTVDTPHKPIYGKPQLAIDGNSANDEHWESDISPATELQDHEVITAQTFRPPSPCLQ